MVVWGAYLRSLSSRPLLTKSLSSGVLFGVGDVLAQSISHDKVDGGRACWLTVFGCAVYGPSNHAWFALQERYVNVGGSRKLLQACARVGVHSVVYAPLSVAAFVGWVAFKEDIRGAWGRVEENTFKLWLAGTSFWVPTMLGIYMYVPLQHRVMITSVGNLGWSTYLSMKSRFQAVQP